MALKFSEMTALRVDLARNLEAGFDSYLEEIATGYSDFVAPLLEEGETAPDIRFQLEILKRGVARSRARLQSGSERVVDQSHESEKVRAELALRQEGVETKLRLVRHFCRGFFGSEGVNRVGLKEEPPRGAARLLEHAETVHASLEKPDLGLEPLIEFQLGEGVDTPQKQLAAELEPELSELKDFLEDRHEENRKGVDVRLRRQQLVKDFDRDVRAIVRVAQGLLRVAGRNDLAERFRPILRRIVRRINKAEGAEKIDPETTESEAPADAGDAQAPAAGEAEPSRDAEAETSSETTG